MMTQEVPFFSIAGSERLGSLGMGVLKESVNYCTDEFEPEAQGGSGTK
jgi:hypothetical protein